MSILSYLTVYLTLAAASFVEVRPVQSTSNVAKAPELSAWKTVRSKRCSLKMPMTPYASSHTNLVRGEQFNYDVLVAPVDNKAVYLLLIAEYPRAIPKNQQQTNLEQFLTWINSQNPENRLESATLIQHQGREAMDFVIRNGAVCFSGRLVIAESCVYLMAVECDASLAKSIPVESYINSLELF